MQDAAGLPPDLPHDPFAIAPRLWFGVLCEAVGQDAQRRINLMGVFNRIKLFDPPEDTGVTSHALLNGILAIGFSGGLGHFETRVELRDEDERTLWQRPEGRWAFDLGPGEQGGAVLIEQVRFWFTQLGLYHYWVRVEPTGEEYRIQFEVHRQIAPIEVQQDDQPRAPQ